MEIAVIGAGLMSRAAVFDLARSPGVERVRLFDLDADVARAVAAEHGAGRATGAHLDASDEGAVTDALRGCAAALACARSARTPSRTVSWSVAGGLWLGVGGLLFLALSLGD